MKGYMRRLEEKAAVGKGIENTWVARKKHIEVFTVEQALWWKWGSGR